MIRIALYQPSDYPLLESWWQGHGWPAVPAAVLPKLGVVAMNEDTAVAAAFLYMDNSVGVSFMEWIVTNPEASPRGVAVAICSIVRFLRKEAASLGYGVMLSTCKQESLSHLLVREGFQVTDNSMIHHLVFNPLPEN